MSSDHLQRVLSDRGVASRRACERLIRDGRVTVDGVVLADPAAMVDPRSHHIRVDGEALPPAPKPAWLVLHKAKGCLTTRDDPEQRKTIWDDLPPLPSNVEAVGRLDFHTEGVLLLTNDGELAYRLTHPSYGVPKTYLVKVSGTPELRKLKQIAKGVELEDGPTGPALVRMVDARGPSSWLLIMIAEGRNRVVRRLIDHIGHRTLKLRRIGFGGITLRGLGPGEVREITPGELEHLRRLTREPGPARLESSPDIELAISEALHLATPPEPRREPREPGQDAPPRKKGWARPKGGAVKPGWRKKAARMRRGVTVEHRGRD